MYLQQRKKRSERNRLINGEIWHNNNAQELPLGTRRSLSGYRHTLSPGLDAPVMTQSRGDIRSIFVILQLDHGVVVDMRLGKRLVEDDWLLSILFYWMPHDTVRTNAKETL